MKKRRLRRNKTRRIGGDVLTQEEYNALPNTKPYIIDNSDPNKSYYHRDYILSKLPKEEGNSIITKEEERLAKNKKEKEAAAALYKKISSDLTEKIKKQQEDQESLTKKILTHQEYNNLPSNTKYLWKRDKAQSNSTFFSPKYTYIYKTPEEIIEWKVRNRREGHSISEGEYKLLKPNLQRLFYCYEEQSGIIEWTGKTVCSRKR